MRKRVLISAISFILICSLFTSFAFATALRASKYISSYKAVISPAGDGDVTVNCSVVATGQMETLGMQSIKIYSGNGVKLATYSYTTPGYEYLMGSDTGRKSASITYSGVSGRSYYAVITFYASDGSGSDSKSYTTVTITA